MAGKSSAAYLKAAERQVDIAGNVYGTVTAIRFVDYDFENKTGLWDCRCSVCNQTVELSRQWLEKEGKRTCTNCFPVVEKFHPPTSKQCAEVLALDAEQQADFYRIIDARRWDTRNVGEALAEVKRGRANVALWYTAAANVTPTAGSCLADAAEKAGVLWAAM